MNTPDQFEELRRALADLSTVQPWFVVDAPWGRGDYVVAGHQDPHLGRYVADTADIDGEGVDVLENAAFIAAANPATVRNLLAELDALRKAAHDGDALNRVVRDVLDEVERAMRKFPTWPTDPLHALAVLGEEFGELTKDMLQLSYEPSKTSEANVRTEAIQTAAMTLRLLMSLKSYEYRPCAQHSQTSNHGEG